MLAPTLFLATALAQAAPASPADGGLTFQWKPGETVSYLAEMAIDSPTVLWLYGRENAQARFFRIEMAARYDCSGGPKGKEVLLSCSIPEVRMGGTAVSTDQDQVPQILTEYQALLKSATLEIVLRPDGHIKLVDIEGMPQDLIRENDIHEMIRQLVRRSVSPLGMQTPKGGADPGRSWRHKGPPAFLELISKYGSSGGMRYEYAVAGEKGGITAITAEGEAMVATTAQREAGIPASLSMVANGSYRFDTGAGQLAYAEVEVSGLTTASYSLPGSQQGYGFGARMMRINADGSIEGVEGPIQP